MNSSSLKKVSEEHARLAELLKNLYHATQKDRIDDREVANALAGILAETEEHFALEESIMSENAYPGLSDHRKSHEQVLSIIRNVCSSYDSGDLNIASEAYTRIQFEMLMHFKGFDKDMIKAVSGKK